MELRFDSETGRPVKPVVDQALEQGYSLTHAQRIRNIQTSGDDTPAASPSLSLYELADREFQSSTADLDAEPDQIVSSLYTKEKVNAMRVKWKSYYHDLDPTYDGKYLSDTQEAALAGFIQAGQKAAEVLATRKNKTASYFALEETVRQGETARQALFESHIGFALYCARESVGIKHTQRSAKADSSNDEEGELPKPARGTVGKYRPLHSLKSPYAVLQDREQSAVEGLWVASGKFEANKKAKFTTYATYQIQQSIERRSHDEEHNTIRLPTHVHEKIFAYFGNHPTYDPEQIPPEIQRLLNLQVPAEMPDDLEDKWIDYRLNPALQAEASLSRVKIASLLDGLTERERGIVMARSGLTEDLEPQSLEATGGQYGISKQRVQQIYGKAIGKLSSTSIMQTLIDSIETVDAVSDAYSSQDNYIPTDNEATHYSTQNFTERSSLSVDDLPLRTLGRRTLQSWQLHPNERWEDPVRYEIESGQDQEVVAAVTALLNQCQTWHFDERVAKGSKRPYSTALMGRVEILRGDKKFSPQQAQYIWDAFIHQGLERLEKELGVNVAYERIGPFFSELIANHTELAGTFDTPVIIKIPDFAAGKLDNLITRLQYGKVIVDGYAGENTGARCGTQAEVVNINLPEIPAEQDTEIVLPQSQDAEINEAQVNKPERQTKTPVELTEPEAERPVVPEPPRNLVVEPEEKVPQPIEMSQRRSLPAQELPPAPAPEVPRAVIERQPSRKGVFKRFVDWLFEPN